MRFMMMIKSDEQAEAGVMPEAKLIAAMGKYNDELVKAGALLAAEGLHPSSKGTRLRVTKGKLTVTDGPFAEAKELIAGFWLIQVKSKEEAIAWALRCPFEAGETAANRGGTGQIELRQVFELSDFPVNEDESGWREQEAEFRAQSENLHPVAAAAKSSAAPDTSSKKRFMLLVKADQNSEAGVMPSEKLLAEMGSLMGEMVQTGAAIGGEGLQPSAKGARITYSGGKRTVTDGPFTETKELIAGYSLIQVKSKEEAIEWARRMVLIDAAGRGGEAALEVRQVFDESDFPAELVANTSEVISAEREFRERTAQ